MMAEESESKETTKKRADFSIYQKHKINMSEATINKK